MRMPAFLLPVGLSLSLGALCARAAPSFTPLPLGEWANTAFADRQPDDRQGGWTDQGGNDLSVMKPGTLEGSGIPFTVLDDAVTGGKSCIVLGGAQRAYLPQSANVAVDNVQGDYLYLLHGAAWCPPAKEQKMTGVLVVDYTDGSSSEFHVRCGRDVADWAKPDAYKNAVRVWTAYNNNTQVSLFASKFKLKDCAVKTVRLEARDSAWMVAALTIGGDARINGIKKRLALDKTYSAPVLAAPLVATFAQTAPKNIILLIGDGMGAGAIQLTSLYQHKAEGRLVMEQLPVAGYCHTVSLGSNVTDSAASATAISTGYKTKNGCLGVDPDKRRLTTFAELAQQQGRAVGIVTSDAITGATPSGFYAHVSSRSYYSEVATFAAACGFEILIGNANGKAWFAPKDKGGKREDTRDVLSEIEAAGYTVIETHEAFEQAPDDRRVLGFMGKGTQDNETCLARLADAALHRLSRNDNGFFLMVECTITDAGGHSNNPEQTVRGSLQVDWAVLSAVEYARKHGDTLVLVTADHETGGLTSSLAGGILAMDYATTSHTDMPVRIFAYGPGEERFGGTIDNTDIAKIVASLWSLTLPPPGDVQSGPEK